MSDDKITKSISTKSSESKSNETKSKNKTLLSVSNFALDLTVAVNTARNLIDLYKKENNWLPIDHFQHVILILLLLSHFIFFSTIAAIPFIECKNKFKKINALICLVSCCTLALSFLHSLAINGIDEFKYNITSDSLYEFINKKAIFPKTNSQTNSIFQNISK